MLCLFRFLLRLDLPRVQCLLCLPRLFFIGCLAAAKVRVWWRLIMTSCRNVVGGRPGSALMPAGLCILVGGLHVMSSEVSVPITLGEETVCRVEGDELRVYIVDDVADFLKGGGNPKHYGVSFRLEEMKTIQVWYEPFTGYACLRIDFGHRMLAELEPNYVRFWTHHSSKERATDALVLIYERVLEQQKKL